MENIENLSNKRIKEIYKDIESETAFYYKYFKDSSIKMTKERLKKIIEMSYKKQSINATNNNQKTGKAVLCINFPMVVCRSDSPCKKCCYCAKGRQQCDSVLQAYFRNLRKFLLNPAGFFTELDIAIKYNGLSLFRFFDCGDIVNKDFFIKAVELVKNNSNVKFLMYTKKYYIVNDYLKNGGEIPENLIIRFSYWSRCWHVDNPYNLPVAMVDFNNKDFNVDIPANAFRCKCDKTTTCSSCKMCFNSKVKTIVFDQH